MAVAEEEEGRGRVGFWLPRGGGKGREGGKGVEIIAFGWTTKEKERIGNGGAIYWKKKGLYFATYFLFFLEKHECTLFFCVAGGTKIE